MSGNAALHPRTLVEYNEASVVAADEQGVAALATATAASTEQQPMQIGGYEVIWELGNLNGVATDVAPFVNLVIIAEAGKGRGDSK